MIQFFLSLKIDTPILKNILGDSAGVIGAAIIGKKEFMKNG